MKIAIPVNHKIKGTNLSQSFGRAPFFLIYDTKTKESIFLDNSAANSQGGAGIKASQMLVDQKIDAMITIRCGENAADVLNTASIKIYKAISNYVDENIHAYDQGRLSILNEIHAGYHHHGGR